MQLHFHVKKIRKNNIIVRCLLKTVDLIFAQEDVLLKGEESSKAVPLLYQHTIKTHFLGAECYEANPQIFSVPHSGHPLGKQ